MKEKIHVTTWEASILQAQFPSNQIIIYLHPPCQIQC